MAMPKETAPATPADSAEWGKREWHRCEAEKRCATQDPTLAPCRSAIAQWFVPV